MRSKRGIFFIFSVAFVFFFVSSICQRICLSMDDTTTVGRHSTLIFQALDPARCFSFRRPASHIPGATYNYSESSVFEDPLASFVRMKVLPGSCVTIDVAMLNVSSTDVSPGYLSTRFEIVINHVMLSKFYSS